MGERLCFHGHTHVPGIFHIETGELRHDYEEGFFNLTVPALVNPGSVGQPRDGNPDASYLVWDPDAERVEFRRVPYDREGAKRAILDAGLPARFAYRLDVGAARPDFTLSLLLINPNDGTATATDFEALIREVVDEVEQRTGVVLETEVRWWGFESGDGEEEAR